MRKGPLIVYGDDNVKVLRLAKNLPGVDTCHVSRLNVLQLAPGGHLGRFVVFTKDAFKELNNTFGTYKMDSKQKSGYTLNRHVMGCADIARIINSDQVQSKLRDMRTSVRVHDKTKKNPLTNKAMMNKINPFGKARAGLIAKMEADRHAKRAKALKDKKSKAGRHTKAKRTVRDQALYAGLKQSYQDADDVLAEEIRAGNYQPGDSNDEEEDE